MSIKVPGLYGPTATAKELRELLATLPDDTPICAAWEGIITPIWLDHSETAWDEGKDGVKVFTLFADQFK